MNVKEVVVRLQEVQQFITTHQEGVVRSRWEAALREAVRRLERDYKPSEVDLLEYLEGY